MSKPRRAKIARQASPPAGTGVLRSKQYMTADGRIFLHEEAPSRPWEPMRRVGRLELPTAVDTWQEGALWHNAWYECLARSFPHGFPLGNSAYMILSISHVSEQAVHDWREFQAIKNDICGPEWEGLELYPAESRKVDPSNRYYLWCVPPGVITWGLPGNQRRVWDMAESVAPQRPLA